MPNRGGGSGGKLSADTSFSAAAGQHFVGGGGEKSTANMSSRKCTNFSLQNIGRVFHNFVQVFVVEFLFHLCYVFLSIHHDDFPSFVGLNDDDVVVRLQFFQQGTFLFRNVLSLRFSPLGGEGTDLGNCYLLTRVHRSGS